VRVNRDPFALPAKKGAEWIGRRWSSLAWWGENDHVRFLAYTFFLPCTCALLLDREKEIPPNTFLRLSIFDPAVKIRTRVLFTYFV
jgi:hypothetical protein